VTSSPILIMCPSFTTGKINVNPVKSTVLLTRPRENNNIRGFCPDDRHPSVGEKIQVQPGSLLDTYKRAIPLFIPRM
jgi:hypothetical protein